VLLATSRLESKWLGKTGGNMPLKEHVAAKKAQEPTIRTNPEIDAKIDEFIKQNPKLLEYYQALPKEQLIRKLILGKMQRAGYANQRNQEIMAWVEENPEIKAKVEARVKNVPEVNRERALLNAAKTEAMNHAVKSSQGIRA
jgi:hypothetical protein